MTYEDFAIQLDKAIKVGGCVCFECRKCGDRIFWYEGSVRSAYRRFFETKGCYKCHNKKFKVYGYKGPDSEL